MTMASLLEDSHSISEMVTRNMHAGSRWLSKSNFALDKKMYDEQRFNELLEDMSALYSQKYLSNEATGLARRDSELLEKVDREPAIQDNLSGFTLGRCLSGLWDLWEDFDPEAMHIVPFGRKEATSMVSPFPDWIGLQIMQDVGEWEDAFNVPLVDATLRHIVLCIRELYTVRL